MDMGAPVLRISVVAGNIIDERERRKGSGRKPELLTAEFAEIMPRSQGRPKKFVSRSI
jgi:hypothetical protein